MDKIMQFLINQEHADSTTQISVGDQIFENGFRQPIGLMSQGSIISVVRVKSDNRLEIDSVLADVVSFCLINDVELQCQLGETRVCIQFRSQSWRDLVLAFS